MVSTASMELLQDKTLKSFKFFLTAQLNLEGQLEVAISEKYYPQCSIMLQEKSLSFWRKILKILRKTLYGIQSISFKYGFFGSHEHAPSEQTQKRNFYRSQSVTKNAKIEISFANGGPLLHFLIRIWVKFLDAMLAMKMKYCWDEKNLSSQCLLMTLSTCVFSLYTGLIEYNIAAGTKTPLFHCFPFFPCCNLGTL